MKYKVGDKVRIKNKEWYEDNCNRYGILECGDYEFFEPMNEYCGEVVTITRVDDCYRVNIDKGAFCWTDEMIEGLVEDTIITNEQPFKPSNISLEKEMEWNLPEGYIFKDENGNVINATKIVLEKKKKEYPKTYEECCEVLGTSGSELLFEATKATIYEITRTQLIDKLYRLLICRDAYWKIAGEEMRLDIPWEPDWQNNQWKPCILVVYNTVKKDSVKSSNLILVFPTEEMRDAFKENFDPDIEFCKELL